MAKDTPWPNLKPRTLLKNRQKIKTLFILPNLAAGGAERVFSFVAQKLDKKKFECKILIVGFAKDTVYDTGDIEVVALEKKRFRDGLLEVFKFIRKEKPNLVLGTIGHINIAIGFMSIFFPDIKFVIREASVISHMQKFTGRKKTILDKIIPKIAYRNIDAVICQSEDMANDFHKLYGIPFFRINQIGNPITNLAYSFDKNDKTNHKDSPRKYITVGRLSKEKGHERILTLLSGLNKNFIYTLVGDGPEKENLFKLISKLGLKNQVKHIPFSKNVNSLLENHELFLQGSYVEGFPNSVLESCAVGTPVLAFNAPGGTKEIIKNGLNGFLVNSKEEFKKYLNEIDDFEWDRKKIINSVNEKYHPEIIISKYENLLLTLTE